MTSEGPSSSTATERGGGARHLILRRTAQGWSAPSPVHADGWKVPGCPVNGPAVAASGRRVAVAWYTYADERPRVRLAFSDDAGARFGAPVEVDGPWEAASRWAGGRGARGRWRGAGELAGLGARGGVPARPPRHGGGAPGRRAVPGEDPGRPPERLCAAGALGGSLFVRGRRWGRPARARPPAPRDGRSAASAPAGASAGRRAREALRWAARAGVRRGHAGRGEGVAGRAAGSVVLVNSGPPGASPAASSCPSWPRSTRATRPRACASSA